MAIVRRFLIVCVFVALLVGGWYFAADNSSLVTVKHPGGEFGEYKLWVALSGSFGLGVIVATLIAIVRGARMRLVARRYKKLLAGLQSEIHQLRNLPLAEAGDVTADLPDGSAPERGT